MLGKNNNSAAISEQREVTDNIIISPLDILEYFGNNKRPIREGTELLNAGWVHAIGIAPPPAVNRIIGLVIQTSSITARPHEVKLDYLKKNFNFWNCICTCKAGCGEKCKHIAACLLHINRNSNLEPIICTELTQKWGKTGTSIAKKYSAVCTTKMCHVRKMICMRNDVVTEEQQDQFMLMYTEAALNYDLSKSGERNQPSGVVSSTTQNTSSEENDCDKFFESMLRNDNLKKFIPLMQSFININNQKNFDKIQKSADESVNIFKSTMSQTSSLWLTERKLRITGSISYKLFTYCNNKDPNWQKKLTAIYENNFKGNCATRYGLMAEQIAKQSYRQRNILFECGLMISPDLPFLAVSPDGIAFNGDEWTLVEIKSPIKGKAMSAINVVEELNYIDRTERLYKLKKRHEYYGQIQLGLAITNLKHCDFIIFCTFDQSYATIQVPRDETFIENYIETMTEIYFTKVMPYIFKT